MGEFPHRYIAYQDEFDSDIIHFVDTHFSDDPADWEYIGYGEVPGDLTYSEWEALFENDAGPQPENFVPAGEGSSEGDGVGGDGDGEGPPGTGDGDGTDEGGGDGPGEGDGEGDEDGEGAQGDGEGEGDQGDGGQAGTTEQPQQLQDSFIEFCEALLEDYQNALVDLNDAADQAEGLGGGGDAAAEAIGLSQEISDLASELEQVRSEAESLAEAAAGANSSFLDLNGQIGALDLGQPLGTSAEGIDIDLPEPPKDAATGGEPVSLSTGAFLNSAIDLLIDAVGIDIDVTRFYSNQIFHNGSFGAKWDVWFDAHIRELSSGTVYLWTGEGRGLFLVPDATGGLDGGPQFRQLLTRDGTGWRIEDRTGVVWAFDDDGRIRERRDRFGNFVRVLRDGNGRPTALRDTNGREVSVTVDGAGRVTSMTDWSGRVWAYDYVGAELRAVTLPATEDQPQGRTTRYGYTDDAAPQMRVNLETIETPNGAELVNNTYGSDGERFNRVVAQSFTGDAHSFGYERLDTDIKIEPGNRHQPSHRTVHRDGRGVERTLTFNVYGGLLTSRTDNQGIAPGGPPGWTFSYRYDPQLHLEEIELPGSASLRLVHDTGAADPLARHDLVQLRQRPANGGTPAVHRVSYGAFGQPIRFEDPMGHVFEIDLDALGRPVRTRGPEVDLPGGGTHRPETETDYDARGQITRIRSAEGIEHTFEYRAGGSGAGQLARVRRNGAQIAVFAHDALGRVISYEDAAGHSFARVWDAADRVRREDGPAGTDVRRRYRYDAADGIVMAGERNIDESGNQGFPAFIEDTYERDDRGRPIRILRPLGNGETAQSELEWDADDRLVAVTDPTGLRTRIVYEERGLVHQVIRADGTAREGVETYLYDANGLMIEARDPNGNARRYTYDGYLRNETMEQPDGTVVTWDFDRAGRLRRTDLRDSGGVLRERIRLDPDALGRIFRVRQNVISPTGTAEGSIANEILYDRDGRPVALIDDDGNRFDLTWDAADDLVACADPSGTETRFTYDPRGLMTEMTIVGTDSADGSTSVIAHGFAYDALGRLVEVRDSLGNAERFQLDGRGLVRRVERPGGQIEEMGFDLGGRMVARNVARRSATGVPLGDTAELFFYDSADRMVRMRDPSGAEIQIDRDVRGDVTRIEMTDFLLARYDYDAVGNVVRARNGSGVEVEIDHDGLNRVVRERVTDMGTSEGADDARFSYDASGNLVRAETGDHVVDRSFDSLHRLRSETVDGRTATRTYDSSGLPRDLVYPSGFRLRAEWDDSHRLRGLSGISAGADYPGSQIPNAPFASFDYLGGLMPSRQTTGAGAAQLWRYDAAGREMETQLLPNNGAGDQLASLRDGFGRVRHRIRTGLHSTAAWFQTTGWLERERQGPAVAVPDLDPWRPTATPANPSPAGTQATLDVLAGSLDPANVTRDDRFSYDSRGNRTGLMRTGDAPLNRSWSYDESCRVTAFDGSAVASNGAGLVTDDGAYRYVYDYKGRLTRLLPSGGGAALVEISRDALGRAIVVETPAGARRRFYAVNDLIEETDAGGALQTLIVPGSRVDQPIALMRGGETLYPHLDPVGTVFALSDAQGEIAARFHHDAFGTLLSATDGAGAALAPGALDLPFGFQSREAWAEGPDLLDFRARVYRPDWGRFLQTDPLGLAAGANLFVFADNDPLLFVDPMGEFAFLLAAIIGAAVIGGGAAAWFNRDKSGADFWVPVLAGAVGGAFMGSGLGLAGFVAGGAIAGGITGGYEGYKVGGARGAIVGGTFGGAFGGLAGGLGGAVGQRIAGPLTARATQALTGRLSGPAAFAVGSYTGAGGGAAVGGAVEGGINGFGNGVGQSLAAGTDIETALRNGAGATLPGVGYGGAGGAFTGVGTKGMMQAGNYLHIKGGPSWLGGTNSYKGVIGNEGEFFVRQKIGQRINTANEFATPEGKVPDFWGRVRGDVKNTQQVPSLGAQKGQLRKFLQANRADLAAGGDPFQLFLRPGVTPGPRSQVGRAVATGEIQLRVIPQYVYPALISQPLGC